MLIQTNRPLGSAVLKLNAILLGLVGKVLSLCPLILEAGRLKEIIASPSNCGIDIVTSKNKMFTLLKACDIVYIIS